MSYAQRILAAPLKVAAATEEPSTVKGRKELVRYLAAQDLEAKIVAGQEVGTKIVVVKADHSKVQSLLEKAGKLLPGSKGAGVGLTFNVFGTKAELAPGQPRVGKWAGHCIIHFPFKW